MEILNISLTNPIKITIKRPDKNNKSNLPLLDMWKDDSGEEIFRVLISKLAATFYEGKYEATKDCILADICKSLDRPKSSEPSDVEFEECHEANPTPSPLSNNNATSIDQLLSANGFLRALAIQVSDLSRASRSVIFYVSALLQSEPLTRFHCRRLRGPSNALLVTFAFEADAILILNAQGCLPKSLVVAHYVIPDPGSTSDPEEATSSRNNKTTSPTQIQETIEIQNTKPDENPSEVEPSKNDPASNKQVNHHPPPRMIQILLT
ncbi:hypothetical protein Ciccas_006949 [Cichlidogyrus casuarinus]|uniref:Uncharacterized protein n=1 Tax=Cichlidogyrus casuarinus TaxID=1844966 RepID=A0ABD2Q491_9PLAT